MIYIAAALSFVMIATLLWAGGWLVYMIVADPSQDSLQWALFEKTFGPAAFIAVISWGTIGWMLLALN